MIANPSRSLPLLAGAFWAAAAAPAFAAKNRLFIVSSYHPEYLWEQDVQAGVCAALKELGAFAGDKDCEIYAKNNEIETPTAVVRHAWMDTKRKNKKEQILETTAAVAAEIDKFKPDVVVTGDDNATNYIGNRYLGTKVPVVFYGVDETPLKYGLVDSIERPGHNVTGVYQRGYYKDAADALLKIFTGLKTFAIISDDSESGMAKVKGIQEAAAKGDIPLKLVDTIHTNSFSDFKAKTLAAAQKADALVVVNHNTLKDDDGKPVDQLVVGKWYLTNVKRPDFSSEKQFVQEGLLLVAEDSGYRQSYAALRMAYRILKRGDDPATMSIQRPPRGPIILNRKRASMLGIKPSQDAAEQYVDKALALEAP